MKKKSKLVFGAIVIMVLMIILSSTKVLSLQTDESTDNAKILKNLEREKFDYNKELEVTIQNAVKSKNELMNDMSREALEVYDLSYNDINEYNDVEVIRDTKSNRIVNRVKLKAAEIDFDQEGNIVKLINNEDISTIDKDRRDYGENEVLNPINYKIMSSEDIQDSINDIIDAYNLEDYKIVSCQNDLVGTWMVTWNKILFDEVLNPYDVVNLTIDSKDGSIIMFSRNSVEPQPVNKVITEDEAINYAKPIIETLESSENITTNLTTFRPNFYWEENGPYEEASFIRLAWKIQVDNKSTIMIDAETGEILGGDQTLSTDGARAMSLVPTFYNAEERATVADAAFKRLGYLEPEGCDLHVGWVEKKDVMWVLNHQSLYGLFISCHGVVNSDGEFVNEISDGENWTVSASEVTGNWHFVHLAACLTSSTSAFPEAFRTYGFAGRCFVGNNNSVGTRTSYEFIVRFYPKLGSMSVHSAVAQARAETIAAGYSDCSPGFWGDLDYYGWAW